MARGFTLIEVLVALVIISIVIAALYSTFFLSHRAVDAVDESLIRLQEARSVLDTIKREIESAFYENGKSYTIFKLDDRDYYGRQASQLLFTSFSPLLPGVSRITYTAEEDDGKMVLRKKITSAYARDRETREGGKSEIPWGSSVDLVEDVEAFTVEARYNGRWVKTWDSTLSKSIPDEVRISITILPGGGQEQGQAKVLFSITDIAKPMIEKTL
ncbi:MAG: type II secretion system protein GspJ [Thermodesulfovibrionales bacterium]